MVVHRPARPESDAVTSIINRVLALYMYILPGVYIKNHVSRAFRVVAVAAGGGLTDLFSKNPNKVSGSLSVPEIRLLLLSNRHCTVPPTVTLTIHSVTPYADGADGQFGTTGTAAHGCSMVVVVVVVDVVGNSPTGYSSSSAN